MNSRLTLRVLLVSGLLLGCSAERAHLAEVPENTPQLEGTVLSARARTVLDTQGLVISTRPHIDSFHLGYTGLFKAHHPLYFTADSFLYAFHRSYDRMRTSRSSRTCTRSPRTRRETRWARCCMPPRATRA